MSKRIVIADDMLFFRVALKDILASGGFDVVGEAANGAEAVEKVRDLKPDIVILDIVMPLKNGLEAAKDIKRLNLPLKIVMCTSLGYESILEEAIRSGACGYIIKPLDETNVLNILNSLSS